MAPEIVWGVFARLLALVYVVAFASMYVQALPWTGSRGVHPVAAKLARMRADLGTWGAIRRHPSLLWISASDAALQALPLAGAGAALLAAAGVWSPGMLAAAWLIYLSHDIVFALTYPWESLLLEAGFLAIFLPRLAPLPAVAALHAPEPILMFAFHWLLFRLMVGFGKTKFARAGEPEPCYLRGFLISQPIPSPLGWRAVRWPAPILEGGHRALFVIEMVLPFLVFVAGWPRWIAAGFSGLMIAIQLTGNFGFFNILVIVLSVSLLDPRAVTAQHVAGLASPYGALVAVVAGWSILAGLCHFPFNTYVARGWLEWPAWGAATGALRAALAVLRALMPFRTVHAYGVFPPRIGPPLKCIPVIEGSLDGKTWEPFEYRYMPSTERSPARFVAPHTPRLDHTVLYEGFGINPSNYLDTVFSPGHPYHFSSAATLDRLLERLMEPDSPVRRLFAAVPFDGRPPLQMRVSQYVFAPVSPAEHRRSGCYWRRERMAEHLPARGPDAALFRCGIPAPEQFHPDERWMRRRVPRLRPLLEARRLDAVLAYLDPDAAAQWDDFWDGLIPAISAAAQAGWPAVDDLARRLPRDRSRITIDALDRIRGAVTTALLERIEPHVLALAQPRLVVPSYFHASLLVHAVVLDGRDAAERLLAGTAALPPAPQAGALTRGLMFLATLAHGTMVRHARGQRLASRMLPPAGSPPEVLPGFGLLLPQLAEALLDPDERIPLVAQLPNGVWMCDGLPILREEPA